jgi:hypothetical protein
LDVDISAVSFVTTSDDFRGEELARVKRKAREIVSLRTTKM